jgi:hypothetical protein
MEERVVASGNHCNCSGPRGNVGRFIRTQRFESHARAALGFFRKPAIHPPELSNGSQFGMRTRFSSDRKTTSWFLGLASAMVVNRLSIVEYLGLRLEGFRVLDRRAPALSDCEEPFGAVVTDADPDTFAAVSCPALQELPLLAPYTERCSTELIVAPDVALTKLPATNGAVATTTDPAPVLSPSQVRCFFDCQAR